MAKVIGLGGIFFKWTIKLDTTTTAMQPDLSAAFERLPVPDERAARSSGRRRRT